MKTTNRNEQDFEQSMIEHERWTSAILQALHDMRCASEAGLSRHGYFALNDVQSISPAHPASVFPPPPKNAA